MTEDIRPLWQRQQAAMQAGTEPAPIPLPTNPAPTDTEAAPKPTYAYPTVEELAQLELVRQWHPYGWYSTRNRIFINGDDWTTLINPPVTDTDDTADFTPDERRAIRRLLRQQGMG
jgi:hypothetical protein